SSRKKSNRECANIEIILALQKLFEKKDQKIKDFLREYSNRSFTIDRNIAAWLGMKEIEISLTKIEDSSLEKNNHPPEIFDKVLDQVPEKLKEDIVLRKETNRENNQNRGDKDKDKVDLQETHIQKQKKEFKQPLLNKENKNENSRNNELRKWSNFLRKKAETLAHNMKEKEIQSKVELRFGMINGDRKRMLLSLLNKPVNKIKIDRVLKEEENFYQNSELVVEETE
ncbi:19266_t:CDS:2, partial [Gigaspora margarita]